MVRGAHVQIISIVNCGFACVYRNVYYTWFVLVLSSTTLPSSLTSITNIPMRYFLPLAYNKSEPRKMMIMIVYCRKLYNIYLGWIHNIKIVRCIKTWDLIHVHSEYTLTVWPTFTLTYFSTYNTFRKPYDVKILRLTKVTQSKVGKKYREKLYGWIWLLFVFNAFCV